MRLSLGQKLKIKLGAETEEERKKRVAQEKKESEKIESYFKKIRNSKPNEEPKIMSTIQLKKLFLKEAKIYYAQKGRNFIVDENNKSFLNILCQYFANDENFEEELGGELRKGLLVFGRCGVGKSSSFTIIQNISRNYDFKNIWFAKRSAHEIVTEFNESEKRDTIIKLYAKGKLYIDDLGAEKEASNYGKEDIFSRLLELRYNEFLEKGTKTFITTNYRINDFKNRYGIRVADRLHEMFNIVEIDGDSRRF